MSTVFQHFTCNTVTVDAVCIDAAFLYSYWSKLQEATHFFVIDYVPFICLEGLHCASNTT